MDVLQFAQPIKSGRGRGQSGCGTKKEIMNCGVNVYPFIGACSIEFFVTQRTYPQGSEGSTSVCIWEVPGSISGPDFSFVDSDLQLFVSSLLHDCLHSTPYQATTTSLYVVSGIVSPNSLLFILTSSTYPL